MNWIPPLPLLLVLLSLCSPQRVAADIYINAGSPEDYTDLLGNVWVADKYFTSGVAFRTKPAVPIQGTEDDELYLTGRYSDPRDPPMKYDIPLDEGDYKITMHFTDTYQSTQGPGKRLFSVLIEGMLAFEDVDIFSEVGGNTAMQKTINTKVDDGLLTIEFERDVQNPAVSAIEIHAAFEDPTPLFLNCGGESFLDAFGNEWVADTKYINTGRVYFKAETINGTSKEELYQSQRFASAEMKELTYEIPLHAGTYDIYFHFSETFKRITKADQRLFDIQVEGTKAFNKVDVFAEAGGACKALVKKRTIEVTDGYLTVSFGRQKQNPMISGIEVHSAILGSPPADIHTNEPSATPSLSMEPSVSLQPSSTIDMPIEPFQPIRINAGGPNYIDTNGNDWISDKESQYFNTGLTFGKPVPINGTDDATIFQTERWDVFNGPPLTYDIPVPNGIYDVSLYFAEIFTRAQAPMKRVFDVFVEDELIYEDFDIFDEVGGYTALVKETTAVVSDGAVTIRFRHKIRDPKICGIEIQLAPPSSAPSMQPSTSASPTAPTFSPVPSSSPSVAPSMFPTETLLPWTDLNENQNYTARHECSFVQAGDKFYLFGGRERPKRLDIYDYVNDTWSRGASAPKPFNHFQATVHEGLVWVIGSFETNSFPDEVPTKNVYIYDPAGDVWMMGPAISWPRGAGGLAVYNDKFYLLAGNKAGHDGGFVPWFDTYDPRTGQWKLLRDAPHARDHFHAVVLGDKLYAVGGRRTIRGNTLGDTVKEVDVYDFATDDWLREDSLPQDLPDPRASAAAVAFDGKIMIMGGETRDDPLAYDRVDALDPITGRWSKLSPMNHRRHGMQAIVSGDGVFVAGGSPRRGGGQQRQMEAYNSIKPTGTRSEGGVLGFSSSGPDSVTIQHIGGNQGVFVNSIEVIGPSAPDFIIKNKVRSRFLIPKGSNFQIDLQYNGTPEHSDISAVVVVTYTATKELRINLVPAR